VPSGCRPRGSPDAPSHRDQVGLPCSIRRCARPWSARSRSGIRHRCGGPARCCGPAATAVTFTVRRSARPWPRSHPCHRAKTPRRPAGRLARGRDQRGDGGRASPGAGKRGIGPPTCLRPAARMTAAGCPAAGPHRTVDIPRGLARWPKSAPRPSTQWPATGASEAAAGQRPRPYCSRPSRSWAPTRARAFGRWPSSWPGRGLTAARRQRAPAHIAAATGRGARSARSEASFQVCWLSSWMSPVPECFGASRLPASRLPASRLPRCGSARVCDACTGRGGLHQAEDGGCSRGSAPGGGQAAMREVAAMRGIMRCGRQVRW
jgi:hypothetical protein